MINIEGGVHAMSAMILGLGLTWFCQKNYNSSSLRHICLHNNVVLTKSDCLNGSPYIGRKQHKRSGPIFTKRRIWVHFF